MKVDKRKLGKQIKMVRTSKRMTQEELAEMIDVSPTFISLVETGTKALSLSKAIELADVLKVSMDVLFQDNRLQQEESDIAEAAFLLQGCNSYEKEVIVDTIFALKTAMREQSVNSLYQLYNRKTDK